MDVLLVGVIPSRRGRFKCMISVHVDLPAPTLTGTEIFRELVNTLGAVREEQVYKLALEGQMPLFLRQWVEVPVAHGALSGTVYVLPDFFCLGTNEDYLYAPMGALNAERVGDLLGARLPTVSLVRQVYTSSKKQVAQPWGPPYDGSMSHTSRWPVQTAKVRAALFASKTKPGDLVEGHYKNVIVSKKTMTSHGVMLGFWGWFDRDGRPIQGDSQAHGAGYCDYSHGVRYVLNEMVVEGQLMAVDDVLRHEEYYHLISDERFGEHTTYHSARAAHGVTQVQY